MNHQVADESPHDLLSFLDALVRCDPDATAVIDADPQHPVLVSRGRLWQRTLRLRHELRRVGIGRGDCVAVWLPNWSDALCWQFAAASLGAHVIGVNTRYNVDEVTHVLERARPKVMAIAHDFHNLDLADRLHRAMQAADASPPMVAAISGPNRPVPADPANYDVGAGSWVPATGEEDKPSGHEAFAEDPAVAFTTSGSTGKPKLAAHTQQAVVAHARADAAAIGIEAGDVMLCALPLSGVFGFNTAMATLAGGGACLFEPVFDADAVVADMARFAVAHVVGADDLVVRLEQSWRQRPHDLTGWRWLGIADFLGKVTELAEWARAEFGTVTSGVYGSSELFALTAFWPHDEPAPRRWSGGGRPVSPEIEVRVADPVSEEVVATGVHGELQFRGPNVVDAYLGDPQAAQRSFTTDGWFRSGDLGVLAEDGSFSYVCRMGDVLRLRGFLVEPAEIEYRLAAHEAVETTKVVGIRDTTGETHAVAFVTLAADATVDGAELRGWCAQGLAGFKVPRSVHVVAEMPTTSGTNGTKIRAATLREWAQQWETESHGVSQ